MTTTVSRNRQPDVLTPDERAARGKEARRRVPLESHSEYAPPPDRLDPVALLEGQATTRVPDLVPLRYGRMLVSPFTFYRGAALIMAADLAATPVVRLRAQLCGDAHLSNFGVFATPERRLVFDVNDFDETSPARGSGTSSGWSPASPSPAATRGTAARSGAGSPGGRPAPTARRCGGSPSPPTWTSSTPASTSTTWLQMGRHPHPQAAQAHRGQVDKARTPTPCRRWAS